MAQDTGLALRVVSKALTHEISHGVAHFATPILAIALSAAISAPISLFLGSLVQVLVEELFRATQSMDRKLDVILQEPLQTAISTLKELFLVQVTTVEEENEMNRQFAYTFDNLRQAYSYARGMDDIEGERLIRLYQCVVASLRPGTRPFLKIWLPELRESANIASAQSKRYRAQAAAIEDVTEEEIENTISFLASYGTEGQVHGGVVWHDLARRTDNKAALIQQADDLDHRVNDMNLFCNFILHLANNRSNILGLPSR